MFGRFHFNMLGFNNQTFTLPVYLQIVGTSPEQTLAIHDQYDDDFLIYTYKVRRCSKTRSHDWTDCPYAHRGEKARRRDPRKYPYNGVACPEFRQTGDCRRGQNCEFAHGVFEFWLHPSRYRTRSCEAGLLCPRRICFFAHSPDQLRPEVIKDCFRCNPRGHVVNNGAIAGRRGSIFEPGLSSSSSSSQCMYAASYSGALDGGIGGGGGGGGVAVNAEEQEFDVPDIRWVMDLLE